MFHVSLRGVGIGRIGQESTNADGCSWNTDRERGLDARVDVAINLAVPPIFGVITGPYDRIDELEEVEDENPADEDEGRPWTAGDLQVEIGRWNTKKKAETSEDRVRIVWHTGRC